MTTYEVKMGVPLPPHNAAKKGEGCMRRLIAALPVGGMMEIPYRKTTQCYALKTAAVMKVSISTRRLGSNLGIWRTA